MPLTLVLGNKNYSSWSMRPYLALAHHKMPFKEVVIPLYQPESPQRIREYSPAGKVPVLIDGKTTVWDSLAIIEYLSERFPKLGLWPKEAQARAHARAISAEMHAGFPNLRRHCPMNLKLHVKRWALTPEVEGEVARITEIWRNARARYASGGDFLFGAFTAADCMYAPVASRIRTYEIPVDKSAAGYVEVIHALPAFKAWRDAALQEPWALAQYDLDALPAA
jgi:glutathione S-transferase